MIKRQGLRRSEMAKRKAGSFREDLIADKNKEIAKVSASYRNAENSPSDAKIGIDQSDLEFFPGNRELTGELDSKKRERVKEDILVNGIREPLQVWPIEGHLYVVSGNERLSIVRDMTDTQRMAAGVNTIQCVVKKFASWPEARYHLQTVNLDRKSGNTNPVKKLLHTWPPDENPMIYADLRGNWKEAERVKSPAGYFTLDSLKTKDSLLEEQKNARLAVQNLTGWSDQFLRNTISKAINSIREEAVEEVDAEARKAILAAKKLVSKISPALEKIEKEIEDRKLKAAQLKIELRKAERVLKKYGELT